MWGPFGYGSKEHTLNHRFWSRHPVIGAKFDPNGNVIIKYFFWVCFLIAHPEIHYRTMVAQIHWTAQLLPGFLELYYHCHSVLGSMQDESSNMSLLWQARDPSAFSQRAFLIASSTNSSTITVLLDCFEVWDWSKRIHRIKKWDYENGNTDCTVLS